MSDEAHFHLDNPVEKANCRLWGTDNPHKTMGHDPCASRGTASCAVSAKAINTPFFFEKNGHTVTVIARWCEAMLEEFLVPELQRWGIPLNRMEPYQTLLGQCWTTSTECLGRTSCRSTPPKTGRRDFFGLLLVGFAQGRGVRKPTEFVGWQR